MKIYLAGPCDSENRTTMWKIATILRNNIHGREVEIYCPWELKIEDAWTYSQEDWATLVFNADVEAIHNCDLFIMVSVGRNSTAGTNWEQGFAYALGKHIIVIQITNNSTSLMTYCGCDIFISTDINSKHFKDDMEYLIDMFDINPMYWSKDKCYTTLT